MTKLNQNSESTEKVSHTPGEWKVQPFNEWDSEMVTDQNDVPIARCRFEDGQPFEHPDKGARRTTAETEANAKLIAAAPELLKALKSLINLAEYGIEPCVNNSRPEERDGHRDGLQSLIDAAKVTVKKATS